MRAGVILLNFGEPEEPTPGAVVPFLERIFLSNATLEGRITPERARARSRFLAEQRAPGLIREYEDIGGSPLNRQAREQAALLEAELEQRGHDVVVHVAYQFSEPLIGEVVRRTRAAGAEKLIGLPVYPLCGPSTTVAALEELRREVRAAGWGVEVGEVGGWHRHPLYVAMRADAVRAVADASGLDLRGRARLVFSAHGTPLKYIEAGSRYRDYVEEYCRALAMAVGARDYVLGYQNHTNRPVAWTQPDIGAAIRGVDADALVVDAVSFMHEQSETLAELDIELRREAEAAGYAFHRVPVPHADARFGAVLADLVEPFLTARTRGRLALRACRCRPDPAARCLNG